MIKNALVYGGASLSIGLLAMLFKILYTLFPLFNVMDIVVFSVLGGVLAYFQPRHWRVWSVLLAVPSLALSVSVVWNTGAERLQQGIGVGWAYSVVLIPASALVGGFLGGRLSTGRICVAFR